MIAALSGKILQKTAENIVIDVRGVGYAVTVTSAVNGEIGDEISLIIYTDVRENDILLFGFTSQLEREVFLLLKKVKGVGSKVALAIISSIGPEPLLTTIGTSDITALTKVSGVGKKTAERIVVELRESVGALALGNVSPLSKKIEIINVSGFGNVADDAVLALEKLGFSRDRAQKAVSVTLESGASSEDAGELVKSALAYL